MVRFVHLNGPPGIGKSTLAALFAADHPGTLNLDVDTVHQLVGGWQDEQTDTWPAAWTLVRAMAAAHLDSGHDVILPQYTGTIDEISGFAALAGAHGAEFREVVLMDDKQAAIDRFDRRARTTDDPWIRHHHRRTGPDVLAARHDDLMEVIRLRPDTVVLPSAAGAIQETYDLLKAALG